jgi:hypothetical protein
LILLPVKILKNMLKLKLTKTRTFGKLKETMEKTMKKIIARDIGVDAGMIIVADRSYFTDLEELKDIGFDTTSLHLGEQFSIDKGIYMVNWEMPDTWNGKLKGKNEIRIKSGELVVIDPCYVIEDIAWHDWLTLTDYGRNINNDKAFILDEMGGDGCYEIRMRFE